MTTTISPLNVRRSIYIEASPSRVWREFTTFERFRRWFGVGHEVVQYEPCPGGMVRLRVTVDGEERYFGGRILVFEPTVELTFEDDWLPNTGWLAPTLLTIRLSALGTGTLVELFHHGFEETGSGAEDLHDGFEGGWTNMQLRELQHVAREA